MTRRPSITDNMTAAELARMESSDTLLNPSKSLCLSLLPSLPASSQRQEWQEFRTETLGMIEAAKRERHFHILPQLLQRLNTANEMLNNRALA
jgi:hypothetical protein